MINIKRILILLFICGVFYFQSGASDTPPRTNLQLLNEIIEIVTASVKTYIPDDKQIHLQIHFPEYEWFLRNRFFDMFQNEGYKIDFSGENDDFSVFVEIGVEEFGVRYIRVYRRSTFGSRIIEREARGLFSINIEQGKAPIIYRLEEKIRDDVPLRFRDEIENPVLPFTRSPIPEDSSVDRIVGPIVIIGATAIAIYLLFSVRS